MISMNWQAKRQHKIRFSIFFNHLQQLGKQLILTCDKAPAELSGIEDRLLSRFKWGLSAEIKSPDFETRKEIVLYKTKKTVSSLLLT